MVRTNVTLRLLAASLLVAACASTPREALGPAPATGDQAPGEPPAAPPPPPAPPEPPPPPINPAARTPLDYFVGTWRCGAFKPFAMPQQETRLEVKRRAAKPGDAAILYDWSVVVGGDADLRQPMSATETSFSYSSYDRSGGNLGWNYTGSGAAWSGDALSWSADLHELNALACEGCPPPLSIHEQMRVVRSGNASFVLEGGNDKSSCRRL